MIANYNQWYAAKQGSYPEDFENCIESEGYTKLVLCYNNDRDLFTVSRRYNKTLSKWEWDYATRIAPIHLWALFKLPIE